MAVVDLSGTRALVTGAGHGIGAAIASALAEAGADVVIHHGHSPDAAADLVTRLEALGRKSTAIGADVTVTAEVDRLVADAADFLGGLDVVVCNAGHLVARQPIDGMSDEHFRAVVDVNLVATFRTCRAALAYLRESRRPRIITMASLAAHNGGGGGAVAYAAAKAGVVGLTKGLSKELAPQGITVNALAPGFIGDTAFHNVFTPEDTQANIIAGVPLRRAGTAAEVASAAVWLASEGAGYVTGTTIDIDGGAWPR